MVTTLLSSWEIMPQLVIVWNGYLKIDTVLAIAVLLCLVRRSRTDGPITAKDWLCTRYSKISRKGYPVFSSRILPTVSLLMRFKTQPPLFLYLRT